MAVLLAGGVAVARVASAADDGDGPGWAHADAPPGARPNVAVAPAAAPSGFPVHGIDVSHYQGTINWASVAAAGTRFMYAKVTEGLSFVDTTFNANYDGAKSHGIYAGGYHFGRPDLGSATAQADHMLAHVRYTRDGRTLPPMLDIETGTSVGLSTCYGVSASTIVAWIHGFVNEIKAKTGSATMIYTATGFWNQCTGGNSSFGANPLFIAHWSSTPTPLPPGWSTWTLWQYADAGSLPGDQDVFNGTQAQLATLAGGGHGTDTYGYYNTTDKSFHLNNSFDASGSSDIAIGTSGWGDNLVPLVGDWNGDGMDTYGYYNPTDKSFHLKNSWTSTGSSDIAIGNPGWGDNLVPLVGDWNGDGTDTYGYYNPTDKSFHLKNSWTTGSSDIAFGTTGWSDTLVPLVGDWDGNGTDTFGYYNTADKTFHLWNDFDASHASDTTVTTAGWGDDLVPLMGDWDGR